MEYSICRFDGASKESGLNDDTFNMILPYVCWARGDIKKATQGFLSLVETDTRGMCKQSYIYWTQEKILCTKLSSLLRWKVSLIE